MTASHPPATHGRADSPLDYAAILQQRDAGRMAHEALRDGRTALAFQPVCDARHRNRVAFHAAVPRLRDPTGRVIPPADIAAATAATSNGSCADPGHDPREDLGAALDTAALGAALDALRQDPGLRLLLDISPTGMASFPWRMTLEAGLRADPTLGERLIIGISATACAGMPMIVDGFMAPLRGHGLSFALSGFGTAPILPALFCRQDFDMIRLDAAFGCGLAENAAQRDLATMLLTLARLRDSYVIADGVEHAEDAAWLTAAGVDALQGPLLGVPRLRPASNSEAEAPLRHGEA